MAKLKKVSSAIRLTFEKPNVNEKSLGEVYDIRHKIGDGHFAEVNLCISRETQKPYAAKFILKQRFSSSQTYGEKPQGTNLADIDREAFILTNLQHENIVKLHEVFHENDSVVLILDLVTGGELFARVAECERLSEEEASNFVEQILLGVEHMHSLGIVHLDLKPENIMIEDLASRKIKIIDFGLARLLNPNEPFQDMAGTPEFCAPEIISYDPITFATDMWAIGVITYILLSGISPFAGDTQLETFQNILDCVVDYTREEIREVTDMAKDFIQHLLLKEPKKRSTVVQCLHHPWIKYPTPPASPNDLHPGHQSPCCESAATPSSSSETPKFFSQSAMKQEPDSKPQPDTPQMQSLETDDIPSTKCSPPRTEEAEHFPSTIPQESVQNDTSTAQISSPVQAPSRRKSSSQKHEGFGGGLIERLGNAISHATSGNPNADQNSKKASRAKKETDEKRPPDESQTGSKNSTKPTDEEHRPSRGPTASFSQSSTSTSKSSDKKFPNRIWHFGAVSEVVKDLEVSRSLSISSASGETGNSCNGNRANDASKGRVKSHSLVPSNKFKSWNKSKNESLSDWPHKQPNRVQVGRLQQLFESRSTTRTRTTKP